MSAWSENLSDASSKLLLVSWGLQYMPNCITFTLQVVRNQSISTYWPLSGSELLDEDCDARGVGRERAHVTYCASVLSILQARYRRNVQQMGCATPSVVQPRTLTNIPNGPLHSNTPSVYSPLDHSSKCI